MELDWCSCSFKKKHPNFYVALYCKILSSLSPRKSNSEDELNSIFPVKKIFAKSFCKQSCNAQSSVVFNHGSKKLTYGPSLSLKSGIRQLWIDYQSVCLYEEIRRIYLFTLYRNPSVWIHAFMTKQICAPQTCINLQSSPSVPRLFRGLLPASSCLPCTPKMVLSQIWSQISDSC